MKKTILHITDTLGIGGTEFLLANTIPGLPEYEHVIVYLQGENCFEKDFQQYPVYCLQFNGKLSIFKSVIRLRRIIRQHQVDIIHSHLLWSGFIARLARPKKVRLISSLHSVLSKDAFEKNKLSLWMERLTAYRQHDIIGVSQYVIDDYLKYVSFKGRTHLLYNFIPDHFFSMDSGAEKKITGSRPVRCLAIGSLKAVKNYDYIIQAFEKLPPHQFRLDIAGDGQFRNRLDAEIAKRKIPVQLLGKQKNIAELLPQYTLFIQASLYEGFGLSVAEAIAAGLLPVLSDIPVHREITNGKAWYFNLDDTDDLARTLEGITDDAQTQDRLRQLKSHIQLICTSESYFKKLSGIYELNK